MNNNTLYFSKVKPDAIIPTKTEANAGRDIFPCFEEDCMLITPHSTKMIPTGIASAFSSDYYFQLEERGSTGSKGIGQRCGVIDSNFRGEWWIPITNHNDKVLIIKKKGAKIPALFEYSEPIIYEYEKALAQAILLPVPKVEVQEIPYEELLKIESDRGLNMLGSSNK